MGIRHLEVTKMCITIETHLMALFVSVTSEEFYGDNVWVE
jgi:hypothetical protein